MTRLIKKYKNRRLYDMEDSQYITVETLHQYVLKGVAFRVEDSLTNKDITNITLLQIIVEMQDDTVQFLSTDVLRQLILLANHPLSQSMKNVMESFFQQLENITHTEIATDFQKATSQWQEKIQDWTKQWKI